MVATSGLPASTATPAFAEPSAAFPPEKPVASAQSRAVSPLQPSTSAQQPAAYSRPRLAYPQQRLLYYRPPAPSLPLVGFSSDTPHTRFAIELDQGRHVLGWCRNACRVYLWPGRYRVEVAASRSMVGGSRAFRIDRAARVVVSPVSPVERWAWFASTAATWGGFAWGASSENYKPGVLLGRGGLVLSPISWVMFGCTFRPGVDVETQGR